MGVSENVRLGLLDGSQVVRSCPKMSGLTDADVLC